jgi:hypothetical protein
MAANQLDELLGVLKHNPTVEAARRFLALAIEGTDGGFRDLLDRLGGIESLVETSIANAISPPLTRIAFDTALEETVGTWQTGSTMRWAATERILRIISARTPPSGFGKVLSQLSDWRQFRVSDQVSPEDLNYLDNLAVSVLRNYFPVPPQNHSVLPAFEKYVALLWDRLDQRDKRGYAGQLLIELGQLDLQGPKFLELIDRWPEEVIPSLLAWLLNTLAPERKLVLSHLYEASKWSRVEIFQTYLKKYGASFERYRGTPQITLRSGEVIVLSIDLSFDNLTTISLEWRESSVIREEEIEDLTGGRSR